MNALINRFITKNTSVLTLEIAGENQRLELLKFLIALESSSSRLFQIEKNVSHYVLLQEKFLANLP